MSTGNLRRIMQGEVDGETLARVSPWLAVAVESGKSTPLPVSQLADYTALMTVLDGSLVATISGPIAKHTGGRAPPLVTMGVAQRSRHGAALWPLMANMPGTLDGITKPSEPWCAIVIHPSIALHPEATEWLGDFERTVAWAFLEQS